MTEGRILRVGVGWGAGETVGGGCVAVGMMGVDGEQAAAKLRKAKQAEASLFA